MNWLWNGFWHFLIDGLAGLPGWLLVVIAGAALGVAWRLLGWQGVVGAAIALLTLGAYRQGWKDRGDGKPAFVPPVELKPPKQVELRRRRDTLGDLFAKLRRQ